MRIVFPLLNLSMSGGMRVALQYAIGLADRNHEVILVVPDNAAAQYFTLTSNVRLIRVPVQKIGNRDLGYLAVVCSLVRAIPKCDIIFATGWQTVYPALFVSRKNVKKFHLIQHDDDVINSERSLLLRWRNNLLFRYVYRLPIIKIVVSDWLKSLFWSKYKQPTVRISNGVDPAKFNGAEPFIWTPPTETYDILCIARNVRWKGFEDIVSALRLLVPKYPNIRLIAATQDNIKVPSDLPIVLQRPKDDMHLGSLYRSCSVFVCSSWQEGYGLPPLEAMACGVPVITTDCGGVNDFARDNINCLVVPIRHPDKLADAIIRLQSNQSLAIRIAAKGLETAKEFTVDKAVERLEKVLLGTIQTSRHVIPQSTAHN